MRTLKLWLDRLTLPWVWLRNNIAEPPPHLPREHVRSWTVLRIGIWGAIADDLVLTLLDTAGGHPDLGLYNLGAAFWWMGIAAVHQRGWVRLAMTMGFSELISSGFIHSAVLGWNSGNAWFISFIPLGVFLLPQGHVVFKVAWTAIAVTALSAVFWFFAPGARSDGSMLFNFSTNIGVVFTVTALIAHWYRRVADRFEEEARRHDALTGLPNRAWLTERLDDASSRSASRPFSVALLNLDDFSAYNDRHGQAIADASLKSVAETLRTEASPEDYVARMGGDLFAVMLAQGGVGELRLETWRDRVARSLDAKTSEASARVSFSVGAAQFPADGSDSRELLRAAERALAQAKESKPGGYRLFDRQLDEISRRRRQLKEELARSLDQGTGFSLAYQPKLHAENGRLHSFEGLARWTSPTYGPVGPAVFVPLLEELERIEDLGDLVVRHALTTLRHWHDTLGRAVPVAVNASAQQFVDGGFPERTIAWVKDSLLPAELLEIEITESVFTENNGPLLAGLQAFRHAGIRSAVDDFGTGYSSLLRIAQLPVDVIKIDKSFVDQIGQSREVEAVIGWIVLMSRTLKRSTVAEGIETAAQAEFLVEAGCSVFQGYHFSRPLTLADATEWVRRHIPD